MLWSLLNSTQIITFMPLMGLAPPGYLLAFFKNLNFINLDILVVSQQALSETKYIRTFMEWNKNLNLFGLMSDLVGGRTYIFAILLAVVVVGILLAVFAFKS